MRAWLKGLEYRLRLWSWSGLGGAAGVELYSFSLIARVELLVPSQQAPWKEWGGFDSEYVKGLSNGLSVMRVRDGVWVLASGSTGLDGTEERGGRPETSPT